MDNQVNLEQSYLLLVEFLMLVKQRLFELGVEHQLSGMQVITLLLIEKPCQMSSLKQTFKCDPSNVTGIIDGLEQKHLAKRFENSNDRRTKMVKLLPKGHDMRTTLLRQIILPNNRLLAKLSPPEIATLVALIQKITQP